ncbi:hypothetical protein M5D96_003021 [Drosophila gunungcola]|uniref:Uncharacterized protein n=1 Tax=Drosophila gunungcola TaxID=103775 RepID=A0A9P9Z200_9MUSC|nr:hypothetical protein M5D96_003021 [Drosophila gunungcola]
MYPSIGIFESERSKLNLSESNGSLRKDFVTAKYRHSCYHWLQSLEHQLFHLYAAI